jgi:hypothetical protein
MRKPIPIGVHALDVKIEGLLGHDLRLFQVLASGHAARKIGELDAIVGIRLLPYQGYVGCHSLIIP